MTMKMPFITTAASTSTASAGAILTIVFVVLKLTETVAWSWWWVLSPLPASVGLSALTAIAFMLFVAALMKD